MLTHSVAIIVSLCMVGMTVVPSSLIPCCCKSNSCSTDHQKVRAGCCSTGAGQGSELAANQRRSCCNPEPVKTASCCTTKTIKPDCPQCRCLEKMQVVALSGYSVYETHGKTQPAARTVAVADPLSVVAPTFLRLIDESPPGIHPLSVTCSLRCWSEPSSFNCRLNYRSFSV